MTTLFVTPSSLDRFLKYLEPQGDCIIWTGGTTKSKTALYGKFWLDGHNLCAHRFSYMAFVGDIGDGLTIDHLCRNTLCVAAHHLEAVSQRENTLRGTGPTAANARKTYCTRKHPLSGDNLSIDNKGARVCRECSRLKAQRYREAKKK